MRGQHRQKFLQIGLVLGFTAFLLILLGLSSQLVAEPVYARGQGTPQATPTQIARGNNKLFNGSFEHGFYPVSELGFEAPDIGNIPHYWKWFKSDTYGKYDIDNNEAVPLYCPEDDILKVGGGNTLGIFIQSTDGPDARLGIYQTVDVVPGRDYLFSISGTIEVQKGASSPDINNRAVVAFDHTGNSNWQAVPQEEWIWLPWAEQELEFKRSGPDDPDIATVEDYFAVVRAKSDKMTLFIGAWRRWANYRTTIFTYDCVMLTPIDTLDPYTTALYLTELSTTDLDKLLETSVIEVKPPTVITTSSGIPGISNSSIPASSQPAAPAQPTPTSALQSAPAPAKAPAEIPNSGGILETKKNWLLIVVVSVVVIGGLMGAGIWNMRRQKRQD